MRWIRVTFGVSWRMYAAGLTYDVEDESEIRALIANGLATHVPYADEEPEAEAEADEEPEEEPVTAVTRAVVPFGQQTNARGHAT
jgi:hypothetical protein